MSKRIVFDLIIGAAAVAVVTLSLAHEQVTWMLA